MNTEHADEHRRFTRIAFPAGAFLHVADKAWPTELLDISLKGALFRVPADWGASTGSSAELRVTISEGIQIKMQGIITHVEHDCAGMVCEHIDLESAAHLRRLVELNLGNESQLHRELAAMITPP